MKQEKALQDLGRELLFLVDIKGKIKSYNRAAEKTFGKKLAALPLTKVLDNSSHHLLMHYVTECLLNRKEQHFPFVYHSKYYDVIMQPQQEDVAVSMLDITENQHLKSTLSEMMQRLNFASKIAKIGYWELDLVKKEISWSSEMFRIFGLENVDISSKKNIIREQMYKEDLPRYKENLRKVMKTGQQEEGVVRILRPDGKLIYCRYMADYINYNRQNRKIVGTFQDLTDLLEIQHALVAAKESAERLNIEKSYFLAQASHDLQQPVSAMGLFINNLLNANLTGKQQSLVEKIYDSAQSLHHLLKNLLNISNLDARGIAAVRQEFDLYEIVRRIEKEISYKLECGKIKFQIVNCHQKICSDAFLVERILRNFISNAVKYTNSKILVGCRRFSNKIRITVSDNGPGISAEEVSLIFAPYYQSTQIPNNRQNGSGLGLAIAQKTAEILKAEIGVKTKVGKGSCFYLDIIDN